MQALVMWTALTLPSGFDLVPERDLTSAATTTLRQSACELAPQLRTGSLLFSEGDCLAIRAYTASPYTHVAIVVIDEGDAIVYDSMNGAGVRKQSLSAYLVSQSPDELHVHHPSRELTEEQSRGLVHFLDSQLGRSYAVHHHVAGQRVNGVHCAEYVTDALMSIGLLHAERPWKVSPASLQAGITTAGVYQSTCVVKLAAAPAADLKGRGRCDQLWLDMKHCVGRCCHKLSGWFLCR